MVPGYYGTFPLLTGTPATLRPLLPQGIELLEPAVPETLSLLAPDGAVTTGSKRTWVWGRSWSG